MIGTTNTQTLMLIFDASGTLVKWNRVSTNTGSSPATPFSLALFTGTSFNGQGSGCSDGQANTRYGSVLMTVTAGSSYFPADGTSATNYFEELTISSSSGLLEVMFMTTRTPCFAFDPWPTSVTSADVVIASHSANPALGVTWYLGSTTASTTRIKGSPYSFVRSGSSGIISGSQDLAVGYVDRSASTWSQSGRIVAGYRNATTSWTPQTLTPGSLVLDGSTAIVCFAQTTEYVSNSTYPTLHSLRCFLTLTVLLPRS
jgi:hypothetical protein